MVCDFHFNDDIDGTAMADEEANQALDAADHPAIDENVVSNSSNGTSDQENELSIENLRTAYYDPELWHGQKFQQYEMTECQRKLKAEQERIILAQRSVQDPNRLLSYIKRLEELGNEIKNKPVNFEKLDLDTPSDDLDEIDAFIREKDNEMDIE